MGEMNERVGVECYLKGGGNNDIKKGNEMKGAGVEKCEGYGVVLFCCVLGLL